MNFLFKLIVEKEIALVYRAMISPQIQTLIQRSKTTFIPQNITWLQLRHHLTLHTHLTFTFIQLHKILFQWLARDATTFRLQYPYKSIGSNLLFNWISLTVWWNAKSRPCGCLNDLDPSALDYFDNNYFTNYSRQSRPSPGWSGVILYNPYWYNRHC